MTKSINTTVTCCLQCAYCRKEKVNNWHQFRCENVQILLNGGSPLEIDTPIPKWCPLPDSSALKYFIVRRRVEDVTDDYGMEMTDIDELSIGQESYILLTCEKDWGYTLAAKLNDANEENAVVILGRVVTEDEIDIDRSNTQRKR